MSVFVIILGDPLPNFHRCGADHGIEVGIVIRGAPEDFNTQGSFLERLGMTLQGALYDETQEVGEALTLAEQRARKNSLQLFANGIPLGFRLRRPGDSGMTLWIDGRPGLRTTPPASIL